MPAACIVSISSTKLTGRRQLSGQDLAGLFGGSRISGAGRVGIDADRWFIERNPLQSLAEGAAGIGYQFTVEGRGHRQLFVAQALLVEEPGCFLDFGSCPGEDPLRRGVAIGQYELKSGRLEEGLDLLKWR